MSTHLITQSLEQVQSLVRHLLLMFKRLRSDRTSPFDRLGFNGAFMQVAMVLDQIQSQSKAAPVSAFVIDCRSLLQCLPALIAAVRAKNPNEGKLITQFVGLAKKYQVASRNFRAFVEALPADPALPVEVDGGGGSCSIGGEDSDLDAGAAGTVVKEDAELKQLEAALAVLSTDEYVLPERKNKIPRPPSDGSSGVPVNSNVTNKLFDHLGHILDSNVLKNTEGEEIDDVDDVM
eukprot:TRINITY_DN1172_c0_g2_i1.p1 TRINITY_DN1172_c0_g2~~TRINITY_DN1172_c0_g2_i1.p1  ORF type:complete len:266 (+),score=69.50 TRINITY_DN1172_c0_g2_i1:99-800(+)